MILVDHPRRMSKDYHSWGSNSWNFRLPTDSPRNELCLVKTTVLAVDCWRHGGSSTADIRPWNIGRQQQGCENTALMCIDLLNQWLTLPFKLFGYSIFSRENKVQTFFSGSIG